MTSCEEIGIKKQNASYKYCFVPHCQSTTYRNPEKVFVNVPKGEIRKKWIAVTRRDAKETSLQSSFYCCGDHFNLMEDLENYMRVCIDPQAPVILKKGVLPRFFACQPDRQKTQNHTFRKYPEKLKRARIMEEIEKSSKKYCTEEEDRAEEQMSLLKRTRTSEDVNPNNIKMRKENSVCKTQEDIESMIKVYPIKPKHISELMEIKTQDVLLLQLPDPKDHTYATSETVENGSTSVKKLVNTVIQKENKSGFSERKIAESDKQKLNTIDTSNDSKFKFKPNILKKKDEPYVQPVQSIFLTKVDPKNVPTQIRSNFQAVKLDTKLKLTQKNVDPKTDQLIYLNNVLVPTTSTCNENGENDGSMIIKSILQTNPECIPNQVGDDQGSILFNLLLKNPETQAQIDSNNTLVIFQKLNNNLVSKDSIMNEAIKPNSVLKTKLLKQSEGSKFSSQNCSADAKVSTIGSTFSTMDVSLKSKEDFRPSTNNTNTCNDERRKIESNLNSPYLSSFKPQDDESDEEEGKSEDVGLNSFDELKQLWEFCVDLHSHNEKVIHKLRKMKSSYIQKIKKLEKYLSREIGTQFEAEELQSLTKNSSEVEIDLTQSNDEDAEDTIENDDL